MKKKAIIIISSSVGAHAGDAFVERMLLKAIFSDSDGAEIDGTPIDDFSDELDYGDVFSNPDMNGKVESGRTVVHVLGELEEVNGTVNVSYMESEITDMAGAMTVISFSDPGEVTMVRTGGVNTALCFNKALERRICWYNESLFPVDVSVITERFKNTIDSERGGVLDVVYSVEMKGLPMETSHFTLQVKPL